MNFLAHAYLSGNSPGITVGNFLGDFVKGKDFSQYRPEIAAGIELHRAIDAYTDAHDIVQQSKIRLRPAYRHYSGVIVDIFYDHFLAANWDKFHPVPLPEFAKSVYRLFDESYELLPERAQQMLPYMVRYDWLSNYANLDGVQRVLSGMARRTPFDSKMEKAVDDLGKDYVAYESEFFDFFPKLEDFSTAWLKKAGYSTSNNLEH